MKRTVGLLCAGLLFWFLFLFCTSLRRFWVWSIAASVVYGTQAGCLKPCRSWLGAALSPADTGSQQCWNLCKEDLEESMTNTVSIWSQWIQKEIIFFPSTGKISLLLGDRRKLSAEVFVSCIYLFLYLLSISMLTCFSEATHTGKWGNTQYSYAAICEGFISSVQFFLALPGAWVAGLNQALCTALLLSTVLTPGDGTLNDVPPLLLSSIKLWNDCSGMRLIGMASPASCHLILKGLAQQRWG